MYKKCVKRFLDVFFALLFLVLLSPVFLALTVLVRIFLGSPVFFTQERVTKGERVFTMYKFRTMTDKRDENGLLFPDEMRQTKFGAFLRSTSLDELPELVNILKGDLSFVGPRPLLVSYLPYYTDTERRRHEVRGGLVQPEVLYGMVDPTWEEQFELEVAYVDKISFITDIKIVFATVFIIFKRIKTNHGASIRRPLDEERGTKA